MLFSQSMKKLFVVTEAKQRDKRMYVPVSSHFCCGCGVEGHHLFMAILLMITSTQEEQSGQETSSMGPNWKLYVINEREYKIIECVITVLFI